MSETATTHKRRKKVEQTAEPVSRQEVVVHLPLSELHPMPDAPYGVRDDEAMRSTARSIKENGVLSPAIVRPRADGGYEIIAGNRRKHGAELADLATMPCIVRNLDDNEAIIQMVDSNFQREDVLPSERAKAYKMRLEATKRRGARTDLTSPNVSAKFRSDDEIGQEAGISGDTVRNYISLTQLVPELMQMVDEKKIALTPAYQLASLSPRGTGAASGNHRQRTGHALAVPGPAHEETEPVR